MSLGAFGIKPLYRNESQNSIPLRALNINASIKESLATVELNQTFMNLNLSPLECEYSFPIKEECVITSLIIQFSDGTKIKAEIEEESKAQEIYQDSISSGQTAVLAKSELNVITFNIGNIQPNDIISVELKFCFPLQTQLDKWIFTLDNYIFPYSEEEKSGYTEEIRSNVVSCNYYVDFSLNIFSENSISEFSCGQFQFDIFLSENTKHLTAKIKEDSQITPYKSVEISYKTSDVNIPKCMIQEHQGEYTAMLSFLPIYQEENEDLEDLEGSGEYLFILDRSGSMCGDRIEMAKESLALLLKSLPHRSKFNIISFGIDFVCMHPVSVEYNQKTLKNSLAQLKTFKANLGSTNIYDPLNHIYKTQALNDYPRVIFLITDGEVDNPEQVINLIQKNSSTSRVHTFGIGGEVSEYLVKNAAKAGGGISAFINNKSEINQKVIAALQKCIMPALTDWTVNWNEEITPSAQRLSTVYYGERFILYSKLGESLPNSSPILSCFDTKIRARREFTINYSNEIGHGEEIRKLCAKNKIEDLEKAGDNKGNIIEISMKYQVLSPYTAFIAKHINLNSSTEEMEFTKFKKSSEILNNGPSWCAPYYVYKNQSITNNSFEGYSTSIQKNDLQSIAPMTNQKQPSQMFSSPQTMNKVGFCQSSFKNYPQNGRPSPISSSQAPIYQQTFFSLNRSLVQSNQASHSSSSIAKNSQPLGYSQKTVCQPAFFAENQPNLFDSLSLSQKQTQASISSPQRPPSYSLPKLSNPLPPNSHNFKWYSQASPYSPTNSSYQNESKKTLPTHSIFDIFGGVPNLQMIKKPQQPDKPQKSIFENLDVKNTPIENKWCIKCESETKPDSSVNEIFDIFGDFPLSQKPAVKSQHPAKNLQQPAMSQKPKIVNYMKLVEIQAFDGSWTNNEVFDLLEFFPEINEEIRKISLENLIGTLIALAYLNKYCLEQKAEWALIERKALRWLKQNHIDRNLIDLIIEKM